jgi:hypothetical protein
LRDHLTWPTLTVIPHELARQTGVQSDMPR